MRILLVEDNADHRELMSRTLTGHDPTWQVEGVVSGEEALRESEEKYRTILENIEDGYYEVDLAGNFTFFNDSLCRLYGYSEDEFMGMNYRQYMDGGTAKVVYRTFNEVYRTGKPAKAFDWEMIRKDGTRRFVEVSVTLMTGSTGEPGGFRGIVRDITERNRAEKALRESEARYRLLAENANDAIYMLDSDLRMTDVNPFTEQSIGYSQDELVGRSLPELGLLAPASLGLALKDAARVLAGERISGAVYEFITKGGRHLFGEVSGAPIYQEGQVVGVLAIARDITKRKRADEALRESEARYRALVESSSDHIFMLDRDGTYLTSNSRVGQFGLKSGESLVGRHLRDVYPPEVAGFYQQQLEQVLATGQAVDFEHPMPESDGDHYHLDTLYPIHRDGEVWAVGGICRDITKRKRAEEKLVRLSSAVKTSVDSIVIMDVEGKVIDANEAALKMYGTDDEEEVIGQEILDLIAPEQREKGLTGIEFVVEKGYDTSLGYEVITKDGSTIPVELSAAVMRDADAKPIGIVIIARDITERKRAEEALQQAYEDSLRKQKAVLSLTEDLKEEIEERKRAEEALRQSLEETAHGQRTLVALSQAAQAVQRARTPEEVYQTIGDEVAKLGYHAAIFTLTDDREHLSIAYMTFQPALLRTLEKLTGLSVQTFRVPLAQTIVFKRVLTEGESSFDEPFADFMAGGLPELVRPLAGRIAAMLELEQCITAPLTVGDETHGLLHVTGTGLTEADVRAVTTFANQAAIAIHNAQLFRAEREQRELAEALEEAAASVSGTLDLDEVLDRILEQTERVVDGDAFSVILIEDDVTRLARWRGYELPAEETLPSRFDIPINNYFTLMKMAQMGKPVVVADTSLDPDWVPAARDEGWRRSYVGAPIRLAGATAGFLGVSGTRPGQFGPKDVRRVEALASHAATAIENARLYEDTQQKTEELELLLDTATAVSSTLEPDRVLRSVAEKMTTSVGASFCRIALLDENSQTLTIRAAFALHAPDWDPGLGRQVALADAPCHRQAIETSEIIILRQDDPSQAASETECRMALSEDIQSALLIPLVIGNRVLGVVSLGEMRGWERIPFTADRVRICQAMANQAAIAIENARLYEQVRAGREQLRDLADYLQTAREEERTRIAREIHDEFGQTLTALKMDLTWLAKRLPEEQPTLRKKTDSMSRLVDTTVQAMRRVVTELRPGLLDNLGLAAAIEWQAEEFAERMGIVCELHGTDEDIALHPDLATAVFRIFQETLTNVARHAGATRIVVQLEDRPDELVLMVRDNGQGIAEGRVSDPRSLGLMGMRERAASWGGDVTFEGVPGQRTTMTVRVPRAGGIRNDPSARR